MDSPRGPQTQHAPKAEKTDLEMFLRVRGPELLRTHAWNIVTVLLLIVAATVFFYRRAQQNAANKVATNANTAVAYEFAMTARSMFASPTMGDAAARERQQVVNQVLTAAQAVLDSDADDSQKAAALLSRGEVQWLLANAPPQATATTQPVLGFRQRSANEYLADADATYAEILTKYPNEKEYAANALLSLGAIAENRKDFTGAKRRYEQVIGDASLRDAYHQIAQTRLKLLEQTSKPYVLVTPATQPTSRPVMLTPPERPAAPLPTIDLPTTAPATQP